MRDYQQEMNKVLDAFIPDTEYIASDVASKFIVHVEQEDPELLQNWLHEMAHTTIVEWIGRRRRAKVSIAMRAGKSEPFFEAVKQQELAIEEEKQGLPSGSLGGNKNALSIFSQTMAVNGDHLVKRIGDMTKEDHLWVANHREVSGKKLLFEAAFHRAVAERIPDGGKTTDVWAEEEYLRLVDSIESF